MRKTERERYIHRERGTIGAFKRKSQNESSLNLKRFKELFNRCTQSNETTTAIYD